MPNTAPEVAVACAIIWREGQILLSKRHQHAHQGGLWEFPGGKCEANEPPRECLARELHEELGITVLDAVPVCQVPWDYGDKRVRLWVFEVMRFDGIPVGQEGQMLQWVTPNQLELLEFPEANRPITRAVGLPRVARFFDQRTHQNLLHWVAQSEPLSLLYFRGVPPSVVLQQAVASALDLGHAVILTIDQLACYRPGCGVHLRKSDHLDTALRCIAPLDRPWPLTAGIRSLADWQQQQGWPADAWFVSPVRATPTHPELHGMGLSGFAALMGSIAAPAYALGGMTRDDLDCVQAVFGYGVAGIRGV